MRRPATLVLALAVLLAPAPLLGQTSVDDALKGFDEDKAESKPAADPLDDVLEGFDDKSEKPQATDTADRAGSEEPARLSRGAAR
jgi:hypothetical protein